nr:transposase family protein [Streptomyces sp. A012304]
MPHEVLAELFAVDRSTVSEAIRQVRPLLAARGFAVPDRPGLRLRTLEDLFAYAETEGVELRLDGAETRSAARRPDGPGAGRSSPARASRTPSRPLRSATARAACCCPAWSGRAECTTRPPCAPRASPNSSVPGRL